MHLIYYLKNFLVTLANTYNKLKSLNKACIRIEEININTKEIIIHSTGVRTIIKLSIHETIEDPIILSNLIPIQACWLGYYSGLSIEQNQSFLSRHMGLQLQFKNGSCEIISLDRKGAITYLDILTNKTYTAFPIDIAQDQELISCFDPSQACYIGILAGLSKLKSKHHLKQTNQKPALRIIKS